mgnify:CR=1 FL=1
MKRFRNILFFASREKVESAPLKRAMALAENNLAKLTLVDVVEKISGPLRMLLDPKAYADLRRARIEQRLKELERAVAPWGKDRFRFGIKVLEGKPFIEIIRLVQSQKIDLVVKIAQGSGEPSETLFGSTDLNLLRKCPCPVWIFKPDRQPRFSKIMAAIDPDPNKTEKSALAMKILELATSLARTEKSELHVVHTWTLEGESSLRSGRFGMPEDEVDGLAAEVRQTHHQWLSEMLKEISTEDLRLHTHLVKGEAGKAIPWLVGEKGIKLIVMGTVGRTGLPGFFIGNTAETGWNQVHCSVLAVKPDGFVSPVRPE